MDAKELHFKLVHAVSEYDRKQSTRAGYNRFALGHYLARIADVDADVAAGADVRAALVAGFTGRLLDVCLKVAGLATSTDGEQRIRGALYYVPAAKKQ